MSILNLVWKLFRCFWKTQTSSYNKISMIKIILNKSTIRKVQSKVFLWPRIRANRANPCFQINGYYYPRVARAISWTMTKCPLLKLLLQFHPTHGAGIAYNPWGDLNRKIRMGKLLSSAQALDELSCFLVIKNVGLTVQNPSNL